MVHTPIIPDREIVHILPSVSHLEVVVVYYQADKPVEEKENVSGNLF